MADLVLAAKEGYAFEDEIFAEKVITELTSPAGSHGYLASEPNMNGVLVAWGRGIKRGFKLGIVDNIDIAPTIAAILGQKMPGVDGKILREILTEAAER
jgi:hypothetical protein